MNYHFKAATTQKLRDVEISMIHTKRSNKKRENIANSYMF